MIIDMYVLFKVLMLAHTQINIFVQPDEIQIIELKFCLCYQETPALATTLKQITDAKTESTHFLFYIPPQQSWSKKVLH